MVRERSPDTAYWEAELVTGADGQAEVTVPLPDNLTTWQVDVRGLTADTRVGQDEGQVVVTKDLLIRPVTPRFLVLGDHSQLAAVVQNNTQEELLVGVTLQATGFALDDPNLALQQARLPAGGRARGAWWGTAQDVESVGLGVSARAGREKFPTPTPQTSWGDGEPLGGGCQSQAGLNRQRVLAVNRRKDIL